MAEQLDAVVIGAGVVGLAIGRALARAGSEVIVLERHAQIGEEISARNSEVIHGGLYYPEGSLKARLCVRGREQLYDYCEKKGIAHARCGKLIVAIGSGQVERLEALRLQALTNGVEDIELLTAAQVKAREPVVECVAGLRSPSTGIVDIHGLMLALRGDIEARSGAIAVLTTFKRAVAHGRRISVVVEVDGEETDLDAGLLVNSGGLSASDIAGAIQGLAPEHVPATRYAKGNYFALQGRNPFKQLIYPLPEPGGLGVHVTLDLAGRARFGPDVEWIDRIDYDVAANRADAFYAAIRTYWPGLPADSLMPAYAGIRPKLVGPNEPAADFVISGPAEHGVPGLVNLFGIESPGLTSALAIGDEVARRLADS